MYDFRQFIGKKIGSVTIIKELDHGNMAAVFIAFQNSLKRKVAVKVLAKSELSNRNTAEQFRDEAEIIAGLSHPNIIPIFEMGETESFYFQVMQLVDGGNLHANIRRRLKHPLKAKQLIPLEEIFDISISVLDALGYAHEEGIVHQDIKPANILLEKRTNRPLLADFGIARTAQMEYRNDGLIVGTPFYLSPEQAGAKKTDNRTDIYAFGVILFEMLAGQLPLRNEGVRELLYRKLKKPESVFTALPTETTTRIDRDLEKIILKAVEPDLGKRYADAYAFKEDLERYKIDNLVHFSQ